MNFFILFAAVYTAGVSVLAALVVLETELCPLSVRKMLKKRALPLTLEEEEAKLDLRAAHSLRLKKLQLADGPH